jgi:hypothetical protein
MTPEDQEAARANARAATQRLAEPIVRWLTARELAQESPEQVPWVLEGYCARGVLTEVLGSIKGGKSTFIGHMVRCILDVRPFLGVYPERAGAVLWITEERPVSFRRLLERCGLLEQDDLHILMRENAPGLQWAAMVSDAVQRALTEWDSPLIIADTFSKLAGLTDENEAASAAAMAPLEHATSQGLGVILGRHARKMGGEPENAGRGSSAISGVSDIILQLSKAGETQPDTVRKLDSASRFEETPNELLIDLQGGTYVVLGSARTVLQDKAETALLSAMAFGGVRYSDLVGLNDLSEGTVKRALSNLIEAGRVEVSGVSRSRSNPLVYRLKMPTSPLRQTSATPPGEVVSPTPPNFGPPHVVGAHLAESRRVFGGDGFEALAPKRLAETKCLRYESPNGPACKVHMTLLTASGRCPRSGKEDIVE